MTETTPGITADQVAARLSELGLTLSPDQPYRLEKMFPKLTGFGAKGEIRRRVKLIEQVEPHLDRMLLGNEEIWYIARGVQHSIFEAMTIGAVWSNMINQTVFVLTNARLLMAHCNSSGRISEPCWVLYYSEILALQPKLLSGVVDIKTKDGRKYRYSGFPKTDRKAMPQIFEQAYEQYQAAGFAPTCSQSRENMCSHCFTIVPKSEYECSQCGAVFWTPGQIALRSAVFPAWGDFLMKHYPLVIVELLGYVVSWIIAASFFSTGDITQGLLVLAFAHGVDALVTWMIAQKGIHTRTTPARLEVEVSD